MIRLTPRLWSRMNTFHASIRPARLYGTVPLIMAPTLRFIQLASCYNWLRISIRFVPVNMHWHRRRFAKDDSRFVWNTTSNVVRDLAKDCKVWRSISKTSPWWRKSWEEIFPKWVKCSMNRCRRWLQNGSLRRHRNSRKSMKWSKTIGLNRRSCLPCCITLMCLLWPNRRILPTSITCILAMVPLCKPTPSNTKSGWMSRARNCWL